MSDPKKRVKHIAKRMDYHRRMIEAYKKVKELIHDLMRREDLDTDVMDVFIRLDRVLDGWIITSETALRILDSQRYVTEKWG